MNATDRYNEFLDRLHAAVDAWPKPPEAASKKLGKLLDEAHWNCIPSPDGVDPAAPLADYAEAMEKEVARLTEGLKAIVRAHCGCLYKNGDCVCEIAQTVLGDTIVEELYKEPGFHDEDGKHRVIPGPPRRESVWVLLKHSTVDGVDTCFPMATYSTKEKAQAALLRQAEPGTHSSWSYEEHALDNPEGP